jgi:hypothetical protein
VEIQFLIPLRLMLQQEELLHQAVAVEEFTTPFKMA